jgi:hypothetical protein
LRSTAWIAAFLFGTASPLALGAEQVVRNDGLEPPAQAHVVGDFVAGEMAAVVMKMPCSGSITAVQILWLSAFGAPPQTIEENIFIFNTGSPSGSNQNPGPVLLQLEGPLLSPGFLNEYRYIDEAGTIPIDVPVTVNQLVTVALEFGEPTDIANGSASVVRDDGCQAGLNYIYGDPGFGLAWWPSCLLGVSGDFVIRAIVDCPDALGACCAADGACFDDVESDECDGPGETFFEGSPCIEISCPAPTGACCASGGGCLDDVEQDFCENTLGGAYAGNGTSCSASTCEPGACCMSDGSCSDLPGPNCTAAGGTFQGGATSCASFSCPQPRGACCINANCVSNQTEEGCLGFSGTWNGPDSTCTPNPCGSCNDGDVDQDGDVDLVDFAALQRCFDQAMTAGCDCVDMTNDNFVNQSDLVPFSSALSGPQ